MVTSKRPPSRSRPVFLALLLLWTGPGVAQEEEPIEIRMERLEARLAEARGHDRFELLVELTELAWEEKSYTRVVSFGEEARALARRSKPPGEPKSSRATSTIPRPSPILKKMGDIHRYQAEHDQALEAYAAAHRLYETLGDHRSIGRVLNNSALVHENLGGHAEELRLYLLARQAYEALEEYEALNSESLGEESRRAMAEMQAGFEAAEREKAIELLSACRWPPGAGRRGAGRRGTGRRDTGWDRARRGDRCLTAPCRAPPDGRKGGRTIALPSGRR